MLEMNSLNKRFGIIVISFLMVVSLSQFGFFEPVFADHSSKLIKVQAEYPADAGFVNVKLPMRINDVDNTIIFLTFSTPDTADQSNTSRRWELIDDRTIRVFGESNTPTGNNAGNMIIYILEMRSDEFDISTQNHVYNFTADETPSLKAITLSPSVNSSNSFVIYNGLENLADDTSWGSEEFPLVHLNDTHIEFETTDIPNTDQVYGFSVVQTNVTGILVQRGNGILDGTVGEVTDTITPSTAVDRDHTIVLVTGRIDGGSILNADPDEVMVQATVDVSGDIIITRDDDAPLDFIYEWQTISFPTNFINVTHGEISMVDGETEITDTITPVRDFDKSFVISPTGTPMGYGTGSCDSGTAGAMDRCMNRLILTDQDTVTAIREDSTGTNVVNYQVIQLLETEVAEVPQGTNALEQIIKIKGTIPSGIENDFTISPALTNVNKTMLFVSFQTDGTGGGDASGGRKSYELFNSTTLRFFGNADPSVTNPPLDFVAYLIEFTDSSPVVIQNEFLQYPEGLDDGEKLMHMSPINQSGAIIVTLGRSLTGNDSTVGAEELDTIRIVENNQWGYDVDDYQNAGDGSTVSRANIIDFNSDATLTQRGQLTLATGSTTVTPPVAIIRNQSLLFYSHTTTDGDLTASPDTSTLFGTIDSSNDINFTRPSATGSLLINWELVSLPVGVSVQHGIHHQDSGTTNATSTITPVSNIDNSFVVGTEGMIGYGTGSGDNSVDATASFLDVIATVELEDDSTVRIVRGTSTGDFDIGFQTVEFLLGTQFFNLTESIIVVDNFDSNLTTTQDLTDLITIIDLFNSNLNIVQDLSPESIEILDTYTNQLSANQNLPETITILDTFIGQLQIEQNMTAETVTILDAFSADLQGALTLPEVITIVDTYTNQLTTLQDFSDSILINDNFTPSKGSFQTLAETIIILDVFNAQISGAQTMAEVITIIDVFNITLDFMQDMTPETIVITDVFLATLTADVTNIETVDILDAFLATCATCSVTPPAGGTPNPPFGGGGSPSSPIPFGTASLVDLTVEDIIIEVTPGEIIDLSALYTWNVDSEIQIIKFEPERNRWFSVQLPVIEDPSGSVPNDGEIPFSFRLPVNTCQTQNDGQISFNAQTCYESPLIQFPITVSGVSDGRLSTDTATVTVRVQSGLDIPLIWYIVSGLMIFAIVVSWWIAFGRRKHDKDGDRTLKGKHTKDQHSNKELRKNNRRSQRKQSRKEGSLKNRLNERSDRRTQRPKFNIKKKQRG